MTGITDGRPPAGGGPGSYYVSGIPTAAGRREQNRAIYLASSEKCSVTDTLPTRGAGVTVIASDEQFPAALQQHANSLVVVDYTAKWYAFIKFIS